MGRGAKIEVQSKLASLPSFLESMVACLDLEVFPRMRSWRYNDVNFSFCGFMEINHINFEVNLIIFLSTILFSLQLKLNGNLAVTDIAIYP